MVSHLNEGGIISASSKKRTLTVDKKNIPISKSYDIKSKSIVDLMKKSPAKRAKVLGAFLIIIGVACILYQYTDILYLKIGFSAIFLGLFAIFIITEETIYKDINDSHIFSSNRFIYSIIANLGLEGNGIYIPSGGKFSEVLVFVPLHKETKYNLKKLEDSSMFVTEDDGTGIGVLFEPPGFELLHSFESDADINTKKIELDDLSTALQILTLGSGFIKKLSVKNEKDGIINVKITHSTYLDLCKRIRQDMSQICTQVCCPICSTVLCAITNSVHKNVKIMEVKTEGNIVNLILTTTMKDE